MKKVDFHPQVIARQFPVEPGRKSTFRVPGTHLERTLPAFVNHAPTILPLNGNSAPPTDAEQPADTIVLSAQQARLLKRGEARFLSENDRAPITPSSQWRFYWKKVCLVARAIWQFMKKIFHTLSRQFFQKNNTISASTTNSQQTILETIQLTLQRKTFSNEIIHLEHPRKLFAYRLIHNPSFREKPADYTDLEKQTQQIKEQCLVIPETNAAYKYLSKKANQFPPQMTLVSPKKEDQSWLYTYFCVTDTAHLPN